MIQRLHIDELITQDPSGVVFHAMDRETGTGVALRRFFPFGADGGGLEGDEQTAYTIAIRRLTDLRHPGMRTVIGGGCDPIDGMPYIVTEWVEGQPLAESLADQGPLGAQAATELLARALELCDVLSTIFADERVWIETATCTIIHDQTDSARGFTFWLAPLRWLGSATPDTRGLVPILELAEEVLGWRGRVVGDQAAGGLGSWVNWLRTHADRTTLAEAREILAAALGKQAPAPAEVLVGRAVAASPPNALARQPANRLPLVLGGLAALAVAGLGGWLFQRQVALPPPASGAVTPVTAVATAMEPEPPRQSPEAERASALATRIAGESAVAAEKQAAERAAMLAGVVARGGAYGPADSELLLEQNRQEVVVEAVLVRTRLSDSGATLYFEFAEADSRDAPRGYLMTKTAGPEMTAESFAAFIGKTIRIKGLVRITTSRGVRRPEILVADRASIELVK